MDSNELLQRILPYVRGKQVIFGRERMDHLIRQHEAGLVWMMEDFSKNTVKKTITLCMGKGIPCMKAGHSVDIAEVVGMPNIKVITLRKSFSGLKHILEQLEEADLLYH